MNKDDHFFPPPMLSKALVTSSWRDFSADMNHLIRLVRSENCDYLIGGKSGQTYSYIMPKLNDEEMKEIQLMGCAITSIKDYHVRMPMNVIYDCNCRTHANSLPITRIEIVEISDKSFSDFLKDVKKSSQRKS